MPFFELALMLRVLYDLHWSPLQVDTRQRRE